MSRSSTPCHSFDVSTLSGKIDYALGFHLFSGTPTKQTEIHIEHPVIVAMKSGLRQLKALTAAASSQPQFAVACAASRPLSRL